MRLLVVGRLSGQLAQAVKMAMAHGGDTVFYADYPTAHRLYRNQIDVYRKLADSHPDKFRLVASVKELDFPPQSAGSSMPLRSAHS